MPIATSHIFEFIERYETRMVTRQEISWAPFGILRRNLRQITYKLYESGDQNALEISNRFRTLLSESLTVPLPFESSMFDEIKELLGEVETVQGRWGRDIRILYEGVLGTESNLTSQESPARVKLGKIIRNLRDEGRNFKIYCHRWTRPQFETLLIPAIEQSDTDNIFLHSVRDYRNSETFEVLLKFGPLRNKGWGSVPDAIITAPRFNELIQVVWSGCGNEADFGYDPVTQIDNTHNWETQVVTSGEDLGFIESCAGEADELKFFMKMNQTSGKRSAVLVQLDTRYGILYLPNSRVLSFDPGPAAQKPFAPRIPSETLSEGMYVIFPKMGDVDFGGIHAGNGAYSVLWKRRLREEIKISFNGLCRRLKENGLDLVSLRMRIKDWYQPAGTVIPAPGQKHHFMLLMKVLGDEFYNPAVQDPQGIPWWSYAWNEIRLSRGEAIQTGRQGHELIDERCLCILSALYPRIKEEALTGRFFELTIPEGNELNGSFKFFKILAIENGFRVPETELKMITELKDIDQWRE